MQIDLGKVAQSKNVYGEISRVYGFENKDNIQDNRLFHDTSRQSKKVMVSACVTWKGATKLFFVNSKGLKV